MAHFRGIITGSRGHASRLGGKDSGLTVEAQSWQGKVVTRLYHKDGIDRAEVSLARHSGGGTERVLYDGPVAGNYLDSRGFDRRGVDLGPGYNSLGRREVDRRS